MNEHPVIRVTEVTKQHDFVGKAEGMQLAEVVSRAIQDHHECVTVDFQDVIAVSSSAAQMFMHVLLTRLGPSVIERMIIRNTDDYVQDQLNDAFEAMSSLRSRQTS